jgi:hypothetical protein
VTAVAEEQNLVQVEIVTPDGHLYTDKGELVVVPGIDEAVERAKAMRGA